MHYPLATIPVCTNKMSTFLNGTGWWVKNLNLNLPSTSRLTVILCMEISETQSHIPTLRIFFTYYLQDSTGAEIQKKLVTQYLFDAKSGKPFGNSGLGDIYDHRFELLKDYQFKDRGRYKIKFEQLMRVDTLQGILAIGLRVENNNVPD